MLKSFTAIANAIRTAVGGLLQITGPSAGTTRTMTVPDANFTVARTDAAQTFTGTQTVQGNVQAKVQTKTVASGGTQNLFYVNNYTLQAASLGRKITVAALLTSVSQKPETAPAYHKTKWRL